MNEKREQALAQFIDTFGVDSAAEIVMYVLVAKRDTMLLARLHKHLEKAQDVIYKRREVNFRNKYGDPPSVKCGVTPNGNYIAILNPYRQI